MSEFLTIVSELIVIPLWGFRLLPYQEIYREIGMAEWLTVILITVFAVISPGPDFSMVSRNSLLLSRRAGVLTACGIGLGVMVHVSYTLLGVGLLISRSAALFSVLKFAGAAYLIWLGAKMLLAKPEADQPTLLAAPSDFQALRVGFFTNALNPKTTVFIVSLFMQVVQRNTALVTQIGYGLFIAFAHVAWFAAVALFFSEGRVRAQILRLRHWIDRVFGVLLIGFGLALAMANL